MPPSYHSRHPILALLPLSLYINLYPYQGEFTGVALIALWFTSLKAPLPRRARIAANTIVFVALAQVCNYSSVTTVTTLSIYRVLIRFLSIIYKCISLIPVCEGIYFNIYIYIYIYILTRTITEAD